MKPTFLSKVYQTALMCCLAVILTGCDEHLSALDNPIQTTLVMTTTDVKLTVGDTYQRQATTVSPATIVYASSDATVATVDANGVVTGVAAGEATITASVAEVDYWTAASTSYKVTVVANEPAPAVAAEATAEDLGKMIGADGIIYDDAAAATAAGTTAVAMIAYVGSDNGQDAPYNHGLALALSNANGGSTCQWRTSNTDAGHTKYTTAFYSESGLQYNATHNTDEYPAFKAAIANNGTAAPTGCSAWFLASGYQWAMMVSAAGGYSTLKTNAGLDPNRYWTCSENDATRSWSFNFSSGLWGQPIKTNSYRVRSCLAF